MAIPDTSAYVAQGAQDLENMTDEEWAEWWRNARLQSAGGEGGPGSGGYGMRTNEEANPYNERPTGRDGNPVSDDEWQALWEEWRQANLSEYDAWVEENIHHSDAWQERRAREGYSGLVGQEGPPADATPEERAAYHERMVAYGDDEELTAERLWLHGQAVAQGLGERIPSIDDLSYDATLEDVGAYLPDESRLEGLDPATRAAQMRALGAMEEVYSTGGMTPADVARQRLAQQQTGGWLASQRAANVAQAQARGVGGSGLEIAGGLAASQQGAQTLGARDLAMQVQAQNRALQAMQQAGGFAGMVRSSDMGEASAIDNFNMSVARDKRSATTRNVNRQNQESQARTNAYRDRYGMHAGVASMRSGQYQASQQAQQANQAQQSSDAETAAQTAQGALEIARAGLQAYQAYANAQAATGATLA